MKSSKIIVGLIVLGVVGFLLLSSPAGAFILGLKVSNNIVERGKIVKLTASVEMEDGQISSQINYLLLKLKGPANAVCKFLRDGTLVTGCNGIKIEAVNSDDSHGYCSYGYEGTCPIEFKIEIDSSYFEIGNYQTYLDVIYSGKTIEKAGENFTIVVPKKTCSVRANDGSVVILGKSYSDDKLSFFVPLRNAEKGQGTLSAGTGKERFVYDFKVEEIILNNLTEMKLQVSGKYKIGMGNYVQQSGLIVFDKINNLVNLTSKNISAPGMKINFRKDC